MLTSGNINQFKQLSQFKDLKQFNSSVEQWLTDSPFTKAETVAFKRLVRYSAKYAGVCYAKIQTIVSATHNEGIGISRATFERMLNKAIRVGIVTRYHTFKNGGRKGHNVYVFNPYIDKDVSNNKETDASKETSYLFKTDNHNNKRKGNPDEFDHTYVSSNIPEPFVEAVRPFYGHTQDIYTLWNRLLLASRKNGVSGSVLAHMDKYVKTFKESVYKLKQGKVRKSFFGYLYGAWNQTARHLNMESNARSGIFYDWLEGC